MSSPMDGTTKPPLIRHRKLGPLETTTAHKYMRHLRHQWPACTPLPHVMTGHDVWWTFPLVAVQSAIAAPINGTVHHRLCHALPFLYGIGARPHQKWQPLPLLLLPVLLARNSVRTSCTNAVTGSAYTVAIRPATAIHAPRTSTSLLHCWWYGAGLTIAAMMAGQDGARNAAGVFRFHSTGGTRRR